MSVEKSIDLTATGASIEDAISQAIARAGLTIRGITTFELQRVNGEVVGDEIVYRVWVRVWFVVKERLHE
jgi:flavin-binding protein dodecin